MSFGLRLKPGSFSVLLPQAHLSDDPAPSLPGVLTVLRPSFSFSVPGSLQLL